MDLTSVIGFAFVVSVLVLGILTAVGWNVGDAAVFYDLPSVFITIGGSLSAVVFACGKDQLKSVFKAFKYAFKSRNTSYVQLIKDFQKYAEVARREGVLALDNLTSEMKDPFLTRAIQLAVDGVDPNVIEQLLTLEVDNISDRHDDAVTVLKKVASYGPSYGMIGTLIGLVIMLKNLSDPTMIGPSMAVAIITTFYGAVLAYAVATPLAEKLEYKNKEEMLEKQLIIRGIISIQSGDNPRMVVQKLKLFLPPKLREVVK
ncbi:MAG: motility protein A [Planctomycetes bacterium]|nr:motility protein A [Planctomycetota bacterium]